LQNSTGQYEIEFGQLLVGSAERLLSGNETQLGSSSANRQDQFGDRLVDDLSGDLNTENRSNAPTNMSK
jgi:hypothetical protein